MISSRSLFGVTFGWPSWLDPARGRAFIGETGIRTPCSKLSGLVTLLLMHTVGLGLLTIEGHRQFEKHLQALNPSWRLGVFLNGRERTTDLTASDDRRGWVCGLLSKPTRDGRRARYVNLDGEVARFVRCGAVEYRLVKADV